MSRKVRACCHLIYDLISENTGPRIGNVVQQRDLLLPNNPALILIIQSTCFLGPALQCNLAINLLGSVEVFQI